MAEFSKSCTHQGYYEPDCEPCATVYKLHRRQAEEQVLRGAQAERFVDSLTNAIDGATAFGVSTEEAANAMNSMFRAARENAPLNGTGSQQPDDLRPSWEDENAPERMLLESEEPDREPALEPLIWPNPKRL